MVLSVPGAGGTTGGGATTGGGTAVVVVVLSEEYEVCASAAPPASKNAAVVSIKPCFMLFAPDFRSGGSGGWSASGLKPFQIRFAMFRLAVRDLGMMWTRKTLAVIKLRTWLGKKAIDLLFVNKKKLQNFIPVGCDASAPHPTGIKFLVQLFSKSCCFFFTLPADNSAPRA
jgi:hypothetical protein